MFKYLFKLNAKLILIILSLGFTVISCSDDSSELEEESHDLLEGIINYDGSYYGKTHSNTFESYSFEKGNKLKINYSDHKEDNDTSEILIQTEERLKILYVTHIENTNYYKIIAETFSSQTSFLTDESLEEANTAGYFGYKDWEKGVPKEVIDDEFTNSNYSVILNVSISEDKDSITMKVRNIIEGLRTILLKYRK